MKATELRLKSEEELKEQVVELKKEALNLRFQQSGGQLENMARIRVVRRTIAKIKTVLNEKEQNKKVEVTSA